MVKEPRGLPDSDIDQRLSEAATSTGETTQFEPRRRGYVLPAVVTFTTVLAVLVLGMILFRAAGDPFVLPDLATRRFVTTEWRLLQEMQSDLQFQLSMKEAEIARFQAEIEGLNRRSALLEEAIESSIENQKEVLRSARQATLARRENELLGQGLGEAEVAARIDALREELEAADRRALEAYRRDVEADFGAEIETILEERQTVRARLLQAQVEREELVAQLEQTRVALEAELDAAQEAFSQERSFLLRDLRNLTEERRRETAALDILQELYRDAIEAIDAGDLSTARSRLDEILAFLGREEVTAFGVIQNRLSLDQALVGLLREVVARRELVATQGETNVENTALRLLVARQLIRDGERALGQGNTAAAQNAYLRALGLLPEGRDASQALRSIEERDWTEAARTRLEGGQYRDVLLSLEAPYGQAMAEALAGLEESYTAEARQAEAAEVERLARLQTEIRRLERLVAERERTLETIEEDLETAEEAGADLQEALAEERRLAQAIRDEIEGLRERTGTASPGDEGRSTEALLVEAVRSIEEQATAAGAEAGREQLAGDIALLSRYLRGERFDSTAEARRRILTAAEADSAFAGSAVEVQELAVSGLGRDELPLGQERLLGFVVAVDAGKVEVEPLGSLVARPGQPARVSGVAARVVDVRGDRVFLEVAPEDTKAISFRDLVYVEIRAE